jgi:uncharacterized OB-fold protein
MTTIQIPASRCTKCDKVIVPPRDICPYCRMTPTESIQLSNVGSVLSLTELHKTPEGFIPPLKMALVELELGAVVLCLQSDGDKEKIEIGNQVELSFDNKNRFVFHRIS